VLVAAADRALYAAKAAGRDRIEIAKDDAWVPDRRSTPRVSSPQERRRVLVVDAEPEVRQSITALLQAQGYITEEAGGAKEASRLFREAEEPFDVLITSVTMPRTSGFTLVDGLAAQTPDLRVIYMSESLRERVSWPGVPGVVHRFLEKPVDGNVLLETLKDAINEEVTNT
jgi:DNA-binding NtrC family response regulator